MKTIQLILSDSMGNNIKTHAEQHGETMEEFVMRAIAETMTADNASMENRIRGKSAQIVDPVRLNFILPRDEKDALRKYAANRGVDMSTIIRKAIKQYMECDGESNNV